MRPALHMDVALSGQPGDERHLRRREQNTGMGVASTGQTDSDAFSLPFQRSQSRAPSFQAKKIAAVRIAIKTNMSRKATNPTRLKTTAQGNMKIISISKATK